MSEARFLVGDVFDRMAELPDNSVDLLVTSTPFAGSGTTLQAASELGRDSIGIDLDPRNLSLARQRLGMFLVEEDEVVV